MPLTSGRQECAVLHLIFLVLEGFPAGGSKCTLGGLTAFGVQKMVKISYLPDYSSPYWVPADGLRKPLFFWSFLPSPFLMILSALPRVSSSQPLFVPLRGVRCWWSWWLCVFRSCIERRSWRKVAVPKYSESIALVCYFVKCLNIFSLHFEDPLLLCFIARFPGGDSFASTPRKGMQRKRKSHPATLSQN